MREEYAGKKFKCPQCAGVVEVPFLDAEVTELADSVAEPTPVPRRGPPPLPRREHLAERAETRMRPCPRCGEPTPVDAERCPECRARLDAPRRRPKYVPCPRCDAPNPEAVSWTIWGSFYGPALFNHVRCRECGYAYNGVKGTSNLLPAILFITIPLVLILGIVTFLVIYLINRG